MKVLKIILDDEGRMWPETEGEPFTTIELFGIARVIDLQAETLERFNTEANLLLEKDEDDEMGAKAGRSNTHFGH
jgi:hypothetical protein